MELPVPVALVQCPGFVGLAHHDEADDAVRGRRLDEVSEGLRLDDGSGHPLRRDVFGVQRQQHVLDGRAGRRVVLEGPLRPRRSVWQNLVRVIHRIEQFLVDDVLPRRRDERHEEGRDRIPPLPLPLGAGLHRLPAHVVALARPGVGAPFLLALHVLQELDVVRDVRETLRVRRRCYQPLEGERLGPLVVRRAVE